ncbi:MAG: hypothetical protein JO104_12630, partial [Candidatus Eremiobacteraeota bacterium]|nr:hypothetical protein [Candidatus Eremiobacteraeota bacterium]
MSAFGAGCAGDGSFAGGSPPYLSTRNTVSLPAAQTVYHLYVAQGFYGASAVYRYRLRADGLPSKKPEGKLTLDFPFPGSIAVDREGELYVSSSGAGSGCRKKSCFVDVFARGASNQAKPIRVLYVPQQPVFLAVDQRGYLDVSTHPGWQKPVTNVYAPGAKGNDRPINEITTWGVNALGASRGKLYIQTVPLGMGVEAVTERPST